MLKLALGYAIWSYLSYIHFFLVCLVSVEFKSVYVRNLPSDISASEIEEEFKNFGTIKPDGVFLRTRKDVMGVCYAFVEFEDMTSVENAIKASPIYLGGRQVYIEERRPNPAGVRGARRGGGRGRGGYPTEAPRGRFGGRGSGRGNQDGGDYRPRGNGYYRGGGR
jgi:RNA recognition motif-containing protein